MEHQPNHITPYRTHGKVLVVLLFLTLVTILVAQVHLAALTVAVALLIASFKSFIVLTYFMHLKYEILLFRILVIGVFSLFALILFFTFFDYAFR